MIQNFNNKTSKVGDDLKENIKKGSKIDVAAGIFTIETCAKVLDSVERKRHLMQGWVP